MSPSEQLIRAIRAWTEVFIHRSMRDFRRFLSERGLTYVQFSVLMRLHHGHPCGVSDVGEQLGVSRAAASQMVDRLVHMGLVERREDPHDRRVRRLTLTAQGRRMVAEGVAARTCWLETLSDALAPEQQAAVIEALRLLTEAAREYVVEEAVS